MHLFVDSIPNDTQDGAITSPSSLQAGQIGKMAIEHSLGLNKKKSWWSLPWRKNEDTPRKKILFLVCGPEPYVYNIDPFSDML